MFSRTRFYQNASNLIEFCRSMRTRQILFSFQKLIFNEWQSHTLSADQVHAHIPHNAKFPKFENRIFSAEKARQLNCDEMHWEIGHRNRIEIFAFKDLRRCVTLTKYSQFNWCFSFRFFFSVLFLLLIFDVLSFTFSAKISN